MHSSVLRLNGEQTLRSFEKFGLSLVQASVFINGACDRRRTCGLCQIAIHFEGCGQNSSITLIYWRNRPKQNLVKMSFSLIRLQKENLNAQIGNEKC